MSWAFNSPRIASWKSSVAYLCLVTFPLTCSTQAFTCLSHSLQTGMIENILTSQMMANLRYHLIPLARNFVFWTYLCIYSIMSYVTSQGYDSIPAEIPDPKAKKVSYFLCGDILCVQSYVIDCSLTGWYGTGCKFILAWIYIQRNLLQFPKLYFC